MTRKTEQRLETFLVGLISTMIIALVGVIIYGLTQVPWIIGAVVGAFVGIYIVGIFARIVYDAYYQWKSESNMKSPQEGQDVKPAYYSKLENPTLALLDELEAKYQLSTLSFIQLHIERRILKQEAKIWENIHWRNTGNIDPLDLITWVGLINSLPGVFADESVDEAGRTKVASILERELNENDSVGI